VEVSVEWMLVAGNVLLVVVQCMVGVLCNIRSIIVVRYICPFGVVVSVAVAGYYFLVITIHISPAARYHLKGSSAKENCERIRV
jgi:hypothetical protein